MWLPHQWTCTFDRGIILRVTNHVTRLERHARFYLDMTASTFHLHKYAEQLDSHVNGVSVCRLLSTHGIPDGAAVSASYRALSSLEQLDAVLAQIFVAKGYGRCQLGNCRAHIQVARRYHSRPEIQAQTRIRCLHAQTQHCLE